MIHLTVSRVSAIINGSITIVQITIPLALVFILVGVLKKENNAVTWSVVDQIFQSSLWPTLLHTDSAAYRGAQARVSFIAYTSLFATTLLIIAGIVTPLGLSEVGGARQRQNPKFQYVRDGSSFGLGTGSREGYTSRRICGAAATIDCPGQTEANRGISQNLTDIFISAKELYGPAFGSIFDIQPRNFRARSNTDGNIIGEFRVLETLIQDGRYKAVEGLVVDTITGGIGFRNHSMPLDIPNGAIWEETILWMEPDTACVANNLSIMYQSDGIERYYTPRLVDNGGFMDVLGVAAPALRDLKTAQLDPGLRQRAHVGAYYANLAFANLSSVAAGNVTRKSGTSYDIESISILKESILPSIAPYTMSRNDLSAITVDTGTGTPESAALPCQRIMGDDVNPNNIAIRCGMIIGVASKVEPQPTPSELYNEISTLWQQPLYTCATAIKASLKVITFFTNGSVDFTNLEIISIDNLPHSNDFQKPLWAIENTGMSLREAAAFWGPVHGRHEGDDKLFAIRSEHLHLPFVESMGATDLGSLPGAGYHAGALIETYSGTSKYDYSGQNQYAMLRRWIRASETADMASLIPNLIWMDTMANAVVGTWSRVDSRNNSEITTFERVVGYDYRYAIPAVVLLTLWLFLGVSSCWLWFSKGVTIPTLRQMLNQTASGRALYNAVYPDRGGSTVPTEIWIKDSEADMIMLAGVQVAGNFIRDRESKSTGVISSSGL